MRLTDDGMAYHGDVVWSLHQTGGKGQRGRQWQDEPGSNLAMSIICQPSLPADSQFRLSALVALTIAKYLQTIFSGWQVAIKWPNDIYINDKKACGILIENIFRGMEWTYAIIGIGINVNQQSFPDNIPNAVSLKSASGKSYDLAELVTDIRAGILNALSTTQTRADTQKLMDNYNNLLFRRGREVAFEELASGRKFEAFVQEVNSNGELVVLSHSGIETFAFGSVSWKI